MGLHASHGLFRRVTVLEQVEQVLETLLRQMTYTALPMRELWLQMARNGSLSACSLVADTAMGLKDAPFSVAFSAAVEKAARSGTLRQAEAAVLLAFGRECGQYDLTRQTALIKGCLAQLERLREEARGQAVARGQIYRVMGVAGGAALALLLL
ncbi:MAG: stage III sporulation protein AB [Clostridia bacterium]|nr:stage III sporulation protein AB [Clostridia bacterium]